MRSIYMVILNALCTHMYVWVYRFNPKKERKKFNRKNEEKKPFFWKRKSITARVTGNWDLGVIFYIIESKREMWGKWKKRAMKKM